MTTQDNSEASQPSTTPSESTSPTLHVQRLYTREQVFKVPHAPGIFEQIAHDNTGKGVESRVEFATNHQALENSQYDVQLRITVNGYYQGQTAFQCELTQGGVFLLTGFEPERIKVIVNGYCADLLFPYVRQQVTTMTVNGGFAPMVLGPMQFQQLYTQQQRRKPTATASAADSSAHTTPIATNSGGTDRLN